MSDERPTAEQPNVLSFEERVFARFDTLDARLTKLEEAAERKAMGTKPIWEQALAEIMAARKDIGETNARLERIEIRLDRVESMALETRADLREFKVVLREHFPTVK